MVSTDHFRHELLAQMGRVAARGANHILINVRELHSSLADFPGVKDEMISCRSAMRTEMTAGDVDHFDCGIHRDQTCKWGIKWDLCA